jgi:hypothetical protein
MRLYRKVLDPKCPETYNRTARNIGLSFAPNMAAADRLFVSEDI